MLHIQVYNRPGSEYKKAYDEYTYSNHRTDAVHNANVLRIIDKKTNEVVHCYPLTSIRRWWYSDD